MSSPEHRTPAAATPSRGSMKPGPSEDYKALLRGEITSEEYASVAFKADPIAVVVYDSGSKISDEPTVTVFGPFGGWNEARDYASKLRPECEPMCVVMRDPSIWPEPEKAL